MAAQSVTVEQIILGARRRADAETLTPATDFVTDVELLARLNLLYREFIDLVFSCGDAAFELFGASTATITPSAGVYTVPATMYRLLAVDIPDAGDSSRWVDCPSFNFRERNQRYGWVRYRLLGRNLVFTSNAVDQFPTQARVWFVPQFTDAIALGSLDSFNGWTDLIEAGLAVYIATKQDRDASRHQADKSAAAERISQMLKDWVTSGTNTVARVECYPAEYDGILSWYVGPS